jgi:hypothetical protein
MSEDLRAPEGEHRPMRYIAPFSVVQDIDAEEYDDVSKLWGEMSSQEGPASDCFFSERGLIYH